MKNKHLKINLFTFLIMSSLIVSSLVGCTKNDMDKNSPSVKLDASIGLSLDNLADDAKIEFKAGTFESYVTFTYRENNNTVDAKEVKWEVAMKDNPDTKLDPSITKKTTSLYYQVDASELTLEKSIQLVVTANKGDNKEVSRTITINP